MTQYATKWPWRRVSHAMRQDGETTLCGRDLHSPHGHIEQLSPSTASGGISPELDCKTCRRLISEAHPDWIAVS